MPFHEPPTVPATVWLLELADLSGRVKPVEVITEGPRPSYYVTPETGLKRQVDHMTLNHFTKKGVRVLRDFIFDDNAGVDWFRSKADAVRRAEEYGLTLAKGDG